MTKPVEASTALAFTPAEDARYEAIALSSQLSKSIALPAVYEAAKLALAKCEELDEVANWADKAKALAAYARQRDDKTLVNAAIRINARAIQRCGQLLEEIAPSKPGPKPAIELGAGAGPQFQTRGTIAREAGLSPRQQKDALRVARVDPDAFEAAVESPTPPTVTALAKLGTKPSTAHLHGRDPKDYNNALHGGGAITNFAKDCVRHDIASIVRGAMPDGRREFHRAALVAIGWLEKFVKAVEKEKSMKTPTKAPVERVDHTIDEDERWERRLSRTCAGCGCKSVGDDRRCTKCGTVKPAPTRGDGR